MASYEIISDLSEKQIEADVSQYLGYISRLVGPSYRLLDVDESVTGADKQFNWRGCAYFFQFKRPTGLRSTSSVPLPIRRKNESPKQTIRRFREENDLEQEPYSICFGLRKRAKLAPDLQHNVLLAYENPPQSRAVYVCPRELSSKKYEAMLRPPAWCRFVVPPVGFMRTLPVLSASIEFLSTVIRSVPYLRAHISIPPHQRVSNADHFYSFSPHGTDVAFHSPEFLDRGPKRLSDFAADEFRRLLRADEKANWTLPELARYLFGISRNWFGDSLIPPEHPDTYHWLQMHGRLLQSRFGIRQIIALVAGA